jgi:hypothetical protein
MSGVGWSAGWRQVLPKERPPRRIPAPSVSPVVEHEKPVSDPAPVEPPKPRQPAKKPRR